MTQFTDPHDLGGRFSGFQSFTTPAQQAGFPSPPSVIIAGLPTLVQSPIGNTGGALPSNPTWVLFANASSYALNVATTRFLLTVAPYTIAKFQVDDIAQSAGFTFTPVPYASVASVSVAQSIADYMPTPSVAYATWYVNEPLGSYPCACGPSFPPTSQMITQRTATLAAGNLNGNILVEPWMQVGAVRITQTGGSANGFFINTSAFNVLGDTGTIGLTGPAQWHYFPINGMAFAYTVTPLLNGVAGGTFAGQIMFHGLQGPVYGPKNGPLVTNALWGGTKLGLNANLAVAGPGNGIIIPTNPTGTVIRVRGIVAYYTAALGGVHTLSLGGTLTSTVYWNLVVPVSAAGVAQYIDASTWLVAGNTGLVDPTEGLVVFNNQTATVQVGVRYDIIPFQYGND